MTELVTVRLLKRPAWNSPLIAGDMADYQKDDAVHLVAAGVAEFLPPTDPEPEPPKSHARPIDDRKGRRSS